MGAKLLYNPGMLKQAGTATVATRTILRQKQLFKSVSHPTS